MSLVGHRLVSGFWRFAKEKNELSFGHVEFVVPGLMPASQE